jgi:hypothetical protein
LHIQPTHPYRPPLTYGGACEWMRVGKNRKRQAPGVLSKPTVSLLLVRSGLITHLRGFECVYSCVSERVRLAFSSKLCRCWLATCLANRLRTRRRRLLGFAWGFYRCEKHTGQECVRLAFSELSLSLFLICRRTRALLITPVVQLLGRARSPLLTKLLPS